MKTRCVFIDVIVPRSADVTQLIHDTLPLPKGVIRWDRVALIPLSGALTVTRMGYYHNGTFTPIFSVTSVAANSQMSNLTCGVVTSEYVPAVTVQGGVLGDRIEFVAIGEYLDAVPD